ncbi:MAG: outer membrane lipoprotein-sorting protein [Rectinemataceae bacterium]
MFSIISGITGMPGMAGAKRRTRKPFAGASVAILPLLVSLILAGAAVLPVAAQDKSVPALSATDAARATAILKELDSLDDFSGKDYSALYTIVSEKPGEKQNVSQARVYRRDTKDQFVILVMLPEVNKGQGYLREDNNVWFYDPTSRKFSFSSIKENLQNSEAKNADFTQTSLLDDYTIEAIGEGTVGKYPVWILDLKAKNNEVPYERTRLYVRKDRTMLLKQEDFSVSGRLMRTTLMPKYAELAGKLLPAQILIVDEVNKGEKSQITMAEQSVASLPDKVFTKAFLEQVNR